MAAPKGTVRLGHAQRRLHTVTDLARRSGGSEAVFGRRERRPARAPNALVARLLIKDGAGVSPHHRGDACGWSVAGGRRCPTQASGGQTMGNPGRHQATSHRRPHGRWRATVARHPRYALSGMSAGVAALAGVVMIALAGHSGHSVHPGPGWCGLVSCGITLPSGSTTGSPHRTQPARAPSPGTHTPMPQAAPAATPHRPRGRRVRQPPPAPHRTRGHPTYPAHPTPSHPARPTPTHPA